MDVKNMSFKEKLDLIYNCIFDEDNNKDTVWKNNPCVQKDLAPNEYLRLFYDVFGKKEGFLRALYKIFLPKEDVINNDILIIAKE